MSLYARIAALLVIVAAIGAAWWKLEVALDNREKQGYERRAAEDKAAADAQTARIRELQRATEKRYIVQATAREKLVIKTVREIHEAAAPLADCLVPTGVRVRLNSLAASFGADDSTAPSDSGEPVRRP